MKRKKSIHELRIIYGFGTLVITLFVFVIVWGTITYLPLFLWVVGIFAVFYGTGMIMEGFGADLRKMDGDLK